MCTLRSSLWADGCDLIRSMMSENCVIGALPGQAMAFKFR